jgi:D-cysteine desulfhydrase
MPDALAELPRLPFSAPVPTPVEELSGLRAALRAAPRLLVKRDDTIGFAFGGNKARKMQFVAAEARRAGADTLITSGGVQSNHARVTAAAAARLGMRCILVLNGSPPARLTGNALLDNLLGAEVRYVNSRDDRDRTMQEAADEARRAGHTPYVIPLGASTPLGAAAYALAARELLTQIDPPDVIVHATSSGGTQAGLVAGCALAGVRTRVLGISADEPAGRVEESVRRLIDGMLTRFELPEAPLVDLIIEVDDRFVGDGYGISTEASREALTLTARADGMFLDPTYTAKAMAGLIAALRHREFPNSDTILFWHTGGQVALFA